MRLPLTFTFALSLFFVSQPSVRAQDLTQTILTQDSLFWQAYNGCDVEKMATFLTQDLEFYHDKGGLTSSLSTFKESVKTGLCNSPNSTLRRVAKEGTIKVFPLNNYGAIISGEHVFMRHRTGEEERAEEMARFTHIWKLDNNRWKMSRVISYDHQPAPYENSKKEIQLSASVLDSFTGHYEGAQTGKVEIKRLDNSLKLQGAQFEFMLYAQQEGVFFIKEQNLTFSFVKNASGKSVKMEVRENGKVAEVLTRVE